MKRDLPLSERLDRGPNEFGNDIIMRPIGKFLSCLLGLGIWVLIGWLCWAVVSGIYHWVESRPRITGIAGIKFGCKSPKWEDRGGFDGFSEPVTYETPTGKKVYRIVLKSNMNDYHDAVRIIRRIIQIEPKETCTENRLKVCRSCIFKDPNSSRYIKVEYSGPLGALSTKASRIFPAEKNVSTWPHGKLFPERKPVFGWYPSGEKYIPTWTQIEAVDEKLQAKANAEALEEELQRAR